MPVSVSTWRWGWCQRGVNRWRLVLVAWRRCGGGTVSTWHQWVGWWWWRRYWWGGVDVAVAAMLRRHQCGWGRGEWRWCRVVTGSTAAVSRQQREVVATGSRRRGVAAMLRSRMVEGRQVKGVTEVGVRVRGGHCEGEDVATVLQPAPTIRETKGEKKKKERRTE
ncbi:hypothetical protein EDB84DRAFT_1442771 [Lactarius hengduanensis]|nr:hypothetical protein EDB84DRAFT_1442771 [Lactarius hengduanensis]